MRIRNFLFKLIGLLVIAASAGGGWLWMDYQAFRDHPLAIPGDGWRYEVMTGANLRTIARDLKALNFYITLIRHYGPITCTALTLST